MPVYQRILTSSVVVQRKKLLMGQSVETTVPNLLLYSDIFTYGWEVSILDDELSSKWSYQEKQDHINLLELRAICLGLLAFKESRTESNLLGTAGIQGVPERKVSGNFVGQHYSNIVLTGGRGCSFMGTQHGGLKDLAMGRKE